MPMKRNLLAKLLKKKNEVDVYEKTYPYDIHDMTF